MSLLRRLLACAVLLGLLGSLGLLGCPTTATADDGDPIGVWPLRPEPEVVRGFDPPEVVWGSGHRGVDLLGSPGQDVHAALAGTISFTGVLAGRGVVVVDHGETRTTYEPVTATVDRGAVVAQGAVLGHLETAGSHCPPRACLHWGWKRDEDYLDPLRLVGVGPVRLLPLWRDEPVPVEARPFMTTAPREAFLNPYVSVLTAWFAFVLGRSPPDPTVTPAGAPAGRRDAAGPW